MTYSDGDKYEGEVKNNEKHGKGKYIHKDGKIYSEISLGHGKTEHDDWDPNIIFKMFETRKIELKKLKIFKQKL